MVDWRDRKRGAKEEVVLRKVGVWGLGDREFEGGERREDVGECFEVDSWCTSAEFNRRIYVERTWEGVFQSGGVEGEACVGERGGAWR